MKKKLSSFIVLLLFLFPLIEKEVHQYEHKNDLHCTANDKHFHTLEHNCSICGFTIIDYTYPVTPDFYFNITLQQFLFFPFTESINAPDAFQHLPARAPPTA